MNTRERSHPVARRFAQIGVLILVYAALLFGAAGRLDWAAGWAYLGIYVAFIALNAILLLPGRRELIAERGRVAPNTQRWDLVLAASYTLTGPTVLVVGGLDRRFGWTEPFPPVVLIAAGVVMALGYGLFSWAMVSNPFFSTVVRIQADRGHTVATGGPYRVVRHPGYAGGLAQILATAVPARLAARPDPRGGVGGDPDRAHGLGRQHAAPRAARLRRVCQPGALSPAAGNLVSGMKMIVEPYSSQSERLPQSGRHILAQFDDQAIVVYQAFGPAIGHWAVEHGALAASSAWRE